MRNKSGQVKVFAVILISVFFSFSTVAFALDHDDGDQSDSKDVCYVNEPCSPDFTIELLGLNGACLANEPCSSDFTIELRGLCGACRISAPYSSSFTIDIIGTSGGISVNGKARDGDTRRPLDGVSVSCGGQTDITDDGGYFTLADINPSVDNMLTALLPGYADFSTTCCFRQTLVTVFKKINLSKSE